MAEEGQVTPQGDQGGDQSVSLGWRAGLPDEYKEHDWAKAHGKVGDFFKDALKVKSDHDTLKTKMESAIFKPGEKATDEEKVAFRKAMGAPDKADEYEFPQPEKEGMDNSPEMMNWAKSVFFRLGVPKDVAGELGKEWNSFIVGMVEAEDKIAQEERETNEKKFRSNFKSEDEFKTGYELSKRFWNKVTGTNFDEVYKECEAWQVPLFMDFVFKVAKMTGEDTSPAGKPGDRGSKSDMIYDQSPELYDRR